MANQQAIKVGTSGYAYKEWKGSFYPEKIKDVDMLGYYAERFSTVEINNTFYRMPKKEVVKGWRDRVPESFCFILKAPQKITHIKRLKECEDEISYFLSVASELGPQLGALLFQLPPNMKRDDERLDRIDKVLSQIGNQAQVAFEFRHESWLDEVVYGRLRAHNTALCMADTDDNQTPFVTTATFGYARLRGTSYEPADIKEWAKRFTAAPWQAGFVFFKHEDEGKGTAFAQQLMNDLSPKP